MESLLHICSLLKKALEQKDNAGIITYRIKLKEMVDMLSFGSDGHIFADWLETREELSEFISEQLKLRFVTDMDAHEFFPEFKKSVDSMRSIITRRFKTSKRTNPVRFQTTTVAFDLLLEFDKTLIGTDDYMGLAYFWSYEYRHTLRSVSNVVRRKIHAAFLKAKLDVSGESKEHQVIIDKFAKYIKM